MGRLAILGGAAKAVLAWAARPPAAVRTLGWSALRPWTWWTLVRDARRVAVDMVQGGLVVPDESTEPDAEPDDVPIRTVIQLDGDILLKVKPALLARGPEQLAGAFAAHFQELEAAIRPLHEASALRSLLGAALVLAGTGLQVRMVAEAALGRFDWLSMVLGLASWVLAAAGPVFFRCYVRRRLGPILSVL